MANENLDLAGRINIISSKILAIAELIKAQDADCAPGDQKANFGLGEILSDLSHELDQIEEKLTAEQNKTS